MKRYIRTVSGKKKEYYLRFVTAAVPIKFTFSSGIKAIAATHAATPASAASPTATTSPHWPVADGPKEINAEQLLQSQSGQGP